MRHNCPELGAISPWLPIVQTGTATSLSSALKIPAKEVGAW